MYLLKYRKALKQICVKIIVNRCKVIYFGSDEGSKKRM